MATTTTIRVAYNYCSPDTHNETKTNKIVSECEEAINALPEEIKAKALAGFAAGFEVEDGEELSQTSHFGECVILPGHYEAMKTVDELLGEYSDRTDCESMVFSVDL